MFQYTPGLIPNKIMVVGCGGTGSRLVPLLAQFIKTCRWILDPEIMLFDGDTVSQSNLTRQNFIQTDVDKNKATVLATRYSRAFGVNILAVPQMFAGPVHPSVDISNKMYNYLTCGSAVIILCVDSVQARKDIIRYILNQGGSNPDLCHILIDSGNEDAYGQVVLSTLSTVALNCVPRSRITTNFNELHDNSVIHELPDRNLPGTLELPCIPLNIKYFEEMKETGGGSCATLDQTMAINVMMASTIFSIIQNIAYRIPIEYHRINVSLTSGVQLQYLNNAYLKECIAGNEYYSNNADILRPRLIHMEETLLAYKSNVYDPYMKLIEQEEETTSS